jgi:hypothetical protein
MKNQILSCVNENNYICDNQSGFKNNHSTTPTLIKVVDDITESADIGNLLNSCLPDRFQRVVVDGNESLCLRCITGVPQRSI